ncbi:hypothetical protein C1T17_02765 [Sphingobium sp. SCG-1]|nr:hypothetical protein C1T17_02765 [Sphingobium sp. SCG-1]
MDVKPQLYLKSKRHEDKESDLERSLNALNIQPRTVSILDGSSIATKPQLDCEGFSLLHHPSTVTDFKDKEQIKDIYFPEVSLLLKKILGADLVEFPYSTGAYRSSRPAEGEVGGALMPHIDFSTTGAVETISRLIPNRLEGVRRWGIYQIWRALSPKAPVDMPLAFLDGQSVDLADYIPVDTNSDHVGKYETLVLRYNPGHRWIYFSEMTRDDVVVFKTYDSDAAKNVPIGHTAFTDPSAPADAARRTSHELRAFVGWYD